MALKKLERLQRDYDLELDRELAKRRRNGANLRELRDYVNQQVATAAVTGTPVAGEQVFRVITEDVTEQERQDIATRLDEYDVKLQEIEKDFISHEGVRTYLKSELEVEPEQQTLTVSDARQAIAWSAQRHRSIVRSRLERLAADSENFSLGEGIRIEVDVDVICEDSGDIYTLNNFLKSDGC